MDKKMHKILQQKNLEDNEKASLYLQVLQSYVNFQKPTPKPELEHTEKVPKQDRPHIENVDRSNIKEENDGIKLQEEIKDQLINKVPVRYKNTAEEILSFLKRENTVLSWTPQGEILFKGTLIPRTHIVDLINSLLRKSKVRPNGQDIFFKGLKETRLPVEFDVQKKLYEKNKVVKRVMYARKLKWNKY
ncbi:hypothetical protein JTE90_029267 [Oedothorax gibbosus]|uniref:Uncharacterized protein n=1 Tax=Oedothorax gibbosus TaxID=931172 RepID=A0AAV6TVS8_9ARAC|nr:hypothetical protein JTE90_029267 [Oedothorax gibbosus]